MKKSFNFKVPSFKNNNGITLVEIIVTIFIILMFSAIIMSDFPKIRRQFSLSAATHRLAQDLRRAQDMALSGTQLVDEAGQPILAKGFGIYINLSSLNGNNKQYILYGDKDGDEQYDSSADYTVDVIDMDKETKNIIIQGIYNTLLDSCSINFSPPNPKTSISNLQSGVNRVKIVLAEEVNSAITREVYVYTSGLIETK
ncbi:MAG: prepilin-type N-terminal cleavage/methylation domain-containing protein [Candidatus Staskawiczbacteria bacterium]|nr:prepilin-type N-terminal cleavage/methylation domain-containing protein [Candidatus Staskawiczbacteria bacterium]